MRALANDRSIGILVVWDRNDYIAEAEKQLSHENIYNDIDSKDKVLQELANNSIKLFKSLKGVREKRKGVLLKKNLSTLLLNLKRRQI